MLVKDLTGMKFGMLTVVNRAESKCSESGSVKARWECLCECGDTTVVDGYSLRSGHCKSCGCLKRQRLKNKESNNRLSLLGKRYGRLIVVEDTGKHQKGSSLWLCKCDCGNLIQVTADNLQRGKTKSCGCLKKEVEKSGDNSRKHGMRESRMYTIWCGMKQRCFNPTQKGYKDYGGRGITVCDEWKNSFEKFRDWALSNGYSDDLSIDRIDNGGNYEPSNCRWENSLIQANNKRNNRILVAFGESHTLTEWSRITGISLNIIRRRLKKGLKLEDIITMEKQL